MISQSFEPSRRRVAKVLVQKLLRAVEAEKRGLKNSPIWIFGQGKTSKTKGGEFNLKGALFADMGRT